MLYRTRKFQPSRQSLSLLALILAAMVMMANTSTAKAGKHLFILSGQSNMTGTVRDAFTKRVQERLGEENVVVFASGYGAFRGQAVG